MNAIGLLTQNDYCFFKRGFNKVLVYRCACMQPGYSKYFNFHPPPPKFWFPNTKDHAEHWLRRGVSEVVFVEGRGRVSRRRVELFVWLFRILENKHSNGTLIKDRNVAFYFQCPRTYNSTDDDVTWPLWSFSLHNWSIWYMNTPSSKMAAIANKISCTDYFSQTSYKKKKSNFNK